MIIFSFMVAWRGAKEILTIALCLIGEVLSIQGAFSPNVEPFSIDGLQQPLENYGQDGYGGKVNCSMQEQGFCSHTIFSHWSVMDIIISVFYDN